MDITDANNLLLKNTKPSNAKFPGKAKIIPTGFLLPDQARWAADDSKYKFCVKSRQIGWSWTDAFAQTMRLAYAVGPNETWVTSRDEAQAQNYLRDVRFFAKHLALKVRQHGDKILGFRIGASNYIQFANGSRIHSLSSNPDAQAGKRGNRVIDELALHEQQAKLLAIAMPGTTWGGSVSIFSTPRGTNTEFYRIQMEIEHNGNPRGFSYYKMTLEKMLAQGLLYKIQNQLPPEDPVQQMDETDFFNFKKRECANIETFNQEYMCISADEESAFLSYDLITAAEYPHSSPSSSSSSSDHNSHPSHPSHSWGWSLDPSQISGVSPDTELFLGVDIGRDHDLTVFWLLAKVGSTYHTISVLVIDKQPFEEQEAALYELLAMPQLKRCCIDQTGIGRQFTERAQQKFGKYKVEGITFTQATKEDLAFPVRMAFEDRTIKIPSDPQIRTDLRAIKKEPTSTGKIRFTADRSESGHSDRFWSLALALHATKRKNAPLEITIGY
jgi:phage FluMu gp28-like protein